MPDSSPSRWQPLRREGGVMHFRVWEPRAKKAWLLLRGSPAATPMTQGAGGMWQVAAACPEGAQYSFASEWVQELRHHKGLCARFGQPHAEACFAPPKPAVKAAPKASVQPVAKATQLVRPGLASSLLVEEPRPKPSERLGRAEFLLELEEMSQLVSEAEGVHVNFFAAQRMEIAAVEILATDASWGPISLQPAKLEEEGPENPVVWVGDAPSFGEEAADGSSVGLILRVTRRDWRVDPYALVLSMGDALARLQASEALPPGPATWSHAVQPPSPAKRFVRCPDRELVLYELHVGSFTPEGTLSAAAKMLWHVRGLGCTAVSIMPVQQDARRMLSGEKDVWGYDVLSLLAVDTGYGSPAELAAFVEAAHGQGLAVLVDYVANHMMWGADAVYGPHYFVEGMDTTWGPRPNFEEKEVVSLCLAAVEFLLLAVGVDGIRVDSTKSIRKYPNDAPDMAGARFLGELTALCRRHGRLAVAEDLEDGDGVLQQGGLGFHLQWDMAHFCWTYDALVNPMDEFRDFGRVISGLVGLAPGRAHAQRGRVVFMESHDTATSDRYGRLPAAVHNGKAFVVTEEGAAGGDAFQKASGALPYPSVAAVEANVFAARRASLGLVLIFTAPGVPMLLQGQELCESSAYQWPRGPRLSWQRVSAKEGLAPQWRELCRNLIALRRKSSESSSSRPGPLMGDGLHVTHQNGGVLAFLRWAEAADSREEGSVPENALVVVNCTHSDFPYYELGVPPSKCWKLALNTVGVTQAAELVLEVKHKAVHSFPCAIGVALKPYSALVLLQES